MSDQFDDLDVLERQLGDTLRRGLQRAAATVTDDSRQRHRPPLISAPSSSTLRNVLNNIELERTTDRGRQRNGGRLVAAGVLAAAAVAGVVLVISRDDEITPTDEPTTTVTVAAAPTSEHVLTDLTPVEVTLSLPPGWGGDSFAAAKQSGSREAYVGVFDVKYVYSDPCHHTGIPEEVGPTVKDLAAALERQPTREATVTDIEVDGFAGKRVSMNIPDDVDFANCDMGEFRSWVGRYHQGPGERNDVYILDVDGTRVVINVAYFPDMPAADLKELESIVQSIRIDSPALSDAPATTG